MDEVGGDLYDFIRIDDDRFAVLVADVTGHGIPAALLASMLKTAAAAQSHVAGEPGRVVEEINRRLHGQLDGYLVTLAYAVVDTRARRLALSNAGHPAPLLRRRRRSSGAATEVGSPDVAIGVVADEAYSTTRIGLESGDRLVFYTDGLTEAGIARRRTVLRRPVEGAVGRGWGERRRAVDRGPSRAREVLAGPGRAAGRPDRRGLGHTVVACPGARVARRRVASANAARTSRDVGSPSPRRSSRRSWSFRVDSRGGLPAGLETATNRRRRRRVHRGRRRGWAGCRGCGRGP